MDNGRKKIIWLCLLLAGCVLTGMLAESPAPPLADGQAMTEVRSGAAAKMKMKVYVSGAVALPGIYEVETGARAADAINAAGGAASTADLTKVNLAQKLKDGSQVNVPALKSALRSHNHDWGIQSAKSGSVPAAQEKPVLNHCGGGERYRWKGKININTATAAELASLPGIGPALAQRIVAYRRQKHFTQTEDLLEGKGIGQAKFAILRECITAE